MDHRRAGNGGLYGSARNYSDTRRASFNMSCLYRTTTMTPPCQDHRVESSDYDIKLRKFPPPISDKKDISSFKSPSESHKKRETMDDILSAYDYSIRSESRFGPSILPSMEEHCKDDYTRRLKACVEQSSHSLYSEVTGNQQMTPEPRQPMKKDPVSSGLQSEHLYLFLCSPRSLRR